MHEHVFQTITRASGAFNHSNDYSDPIYRNLQTVSKVSAHAAAYFIIECRNGPKDFGPTHEPAAVPAGLCLPCGLLPSFNAMQSCVLRYYHITYTRLTVYL
jgi:hypothetical protein